MSHDDSQAKLDQAHFSAALEWYFDNKPYGSKTILSELLGKTRNYIPAVIAQRIVSPEARRLISAGIGVPVETMLEAGRRILEGQHPGPSIPDFPRTRPDGKPLKPGDLARPRAWQPKTDSPVPRPVQNFVAAAVDVGIFNVPAAHDMRLVPDSNGIFQFPVDDPAETSGQTLNKGRFPGIEPQNIIAVTMTELDMYPHICQHDIIFVDTERKKTCDIRTGPYYMIRTELDGVPSAVPRLIKFSRSGLQAVIYAPDSIKCEPVIAESSELDVMGAVIHITRPFPGFDNPSLTARHVKSAKAKRAKRD
jgi:hypothetical protein